MEIRTDIAAAVVEEVNKLTGKELGWSVHTDIDINEAYTKINLRNIDELRYDRRLTLHITERRIGYNIKWESEVRVPEFKYFMDSPVSRITNFYRILTTGEARLEDIPILLSERLGGKAYSYEEPKKEKLPYIDPVEALNRCHIELGDLWDEVLVGGKDNTLEITRNYDGDSGQILTAVTTDHCIYWSFTDMDKGKWNVERGETTLAWFPSVVKEHMFKEAEREKDNN